MRVFVTGAAGYIGSAVGRALAGAGHSVVGLAHHDRARAAIEAEGWEAVDGDLADAGGLARHAADADAVVHAGSPHGPERAAVDDAAARAMTEALEGTGGPLLYTSGIYILGDTGDRPATEDDPVKPATIVEWRVPLEAWLREAAERGVRTVVIRPGVVYGRSGGLPAAMGRGDLPVIGEGSNRWPVVHVDDLGRLYAAALLRAPAGSILHAANDERATMAEIGARVGARRVTIEEAEASLGQLTEALAFDQVLSTRRTRALTGWAPREPGILDIDLAELA